MIRLSAFLVLTVLTAGCATWGTVAEPARQGEIEAVAPTPERMPEAKALYHFGRSRLLAADGDVTGATDALLQAIRLDPDSTFLRLALARLHLEKGEEEAAIRTAEEALAIDPTSVEAEVLIGNIFFHRGDDEGAIRHFQRALDLDPGEESASLHLGVAFARTGEIERAADLLKSAMERHPESLGLALTLARFYSEIDLTGRAEEVYRNVLAREPGFEPAYIELGILLENRGETEAALKVYREGLAANPDNPAVHHHLARLLILHDRSEEALAALQSLVRTHPEDLEAWRKIGLLLLEQQQWEEAAETFNALLATNPGLLQAHFYLGTALERQGRWREALDSFAEIPPESELYADTLAHLAYVHHRLGETTQAIEYLEARLERPAVRPELFSFLASLYEGEKQFQAAEAVLAHGIKAFPDDLALLYHQGIIRERQGERDQAMRVMSEVLRRDPDHAEALNYIAYGYAERGIKLQEALRMARRALELKNEGHIADTLGWVYFKMGRFQEARRHLEDAVQLLPDDPLVHEHLADTYLALGLPAKARRTYQKTLELDPGAEGVKKKLEEMK